MEKKWIYGRRRRRRRDQTRPDGLGALLPPTLMGGGWTVRVWTKRSGAGLGAGDGRREMGTGCGVWMCGCVDVWIDTHELRKKCEYPRANGKRLLRLIILD
jgi:hypothetical protein